MDSWRYGSGDKGFVPHNTLPPPNTLARIKNSLPGWELKTQPGFSNDILASAQQHLESQVCEEMGFPEMLGKHQLSNDPLGCILNDPNSFSGGEDSASRLSNSGVESNSRDSLIDLKLGRVGDQRDATESPFSKGIPGLCSSESSTTPKRVRTSGVQSQTYCQVYGCNKDLSACKDYHKRHKVCEIHSKTSKVIVNGIEQRFCQQCSRFHLLAEFDDVKRSCRKRLAGHNERRRKPQMGTHSGKGRRLLQSYDALKLYKDPELVADSRFQGSMLTAASFICQEILPSGVLYGADNWRKTTKSQGGNDFRHISAMPITNVHSHSRSRLLSSAEKQYPPLNETGAAISTRGSVFCENNSLYPPSLGDAYSFGPLSSYQGTFLGSEDFNNVFDTASTIQGLSGLTDSGCALSLLSSQSHNSSSYSLAIPTVRPMVTPGRHSHYSLSHASERIMGMSSQALTGGVSASGSLPSEINHSDGGRFGPVLLLDHNDIVNLEIADGIFQGSDVMNMKAREDGPTIDLLQLSSQLHRVEHQRQSLQVKQEHDSFCSLRIT